MISCIQGGEADPALNTEVKLKNMMRVLGEDAVKDPTAVEAKVNREIAERLQKKSSMRNWSRKKLKMPPRAFI